MANTSKDHGTQRFWRIGQRVEGRWGDWHGMPLTWRGFFEEQSHAGRFVRRRYVGCRCNTTVVADYNTGYAFVWCSGRGEVCKPILPAHSPTRYCISEMDNILRTCGFVLFV